MSKELNRHRLPMVDTREPVDTPMDARDATKPDPARPLRPPEGAPNVLVILIDDMGFGSSSAFGGPCRMPMAERMADEGTRFNRFHTTALCSPTRHALLSGRNHHTVNAGVIAELATSIPGYTGVIPNDCATIAEVLRHNGYCTGAFGKWHQTPPWETSPSGPFTRWPTYQGFEKFYGFIGGDTSQWVPALVEGTTPIDPPATPEEGYHLSEDLADQLISWTGSIHSLTPDKPWFAYLSFGATHAPHHVPKKYMDEYEGAFEHGYDEQRNITFARQKEMGIIPPDTELCGHNDYIPRWDELSDTDKKVNNRLFEAYAGMATHTDDQVARVVKHLEDTDQLDNTIIFYILGDNGSSAEAGTYGTFNEMAYQNNVLMESSDIIDHLDKIGGPESFNHHSSGWAQAMSTPHQWSKAVASHYGGTRVGMVVRYPAKVRPGEIRSQFTHVIDVAPTILELADLPAPQTVNGIEQRPLEGTSFVYAFDDADAPERHDVQYFEIVGNRAIYHQGWSAATFHNLPWPDPSFQIPKLTDDTWELYAPDDFAQARNLADEQPEKLEELKRRFLIEGSKYNLFPIDDRQRERFNAAIAGRPDLMDGRTTLTMTPGMTRLNENTLLNVKNRSFTTTATITLGDEPANGAIFAQGGSFGGWTFYMKDGCLNYAHNWVGLELFKVASDRELGAGDHTVQMQFDYDGGGVGNGGTVTFIADGEKVGSGHIEKTVPAMFSLDEGADVGLDSLDPVVSDYGVDNGRFTGTVHQVTIDIDPDIHEDPEMVVNARMRKQ